MAYDYDELFPGRFLKSGEFKGREATITISRIELEEMEERKGKRTKCIVSFKETKKQLVLNRTNGECLKGMFGRDTGQWIGKRITFFPQTVEAFGAPTLAIRIKGSPDIARDLEIVCKVGRQEGRITMRRTGQVAAKANGKVPPQRTAGEALATARKMSELADGLSDPEPPPMPEPHPDMNPETGEVPFDS